MKPFLFVFILSMAYACVPKKTPEYSISKEELFQVFKDVKLAEQALSKQTVGIRDSVRMIYKEQIEKVHGISYSIIEENLIELQKDMALQKKYYEQLRDTLSEYEKKYKK